MSATLRLVDSGHILSEQRQVSARWRADTNKPPEASTRLPAAHIDPRAEFPLTPKFGVFHKNTPNLLRNSE